MKKLLAVLLVAMMVLGIGVCGMVSAGAADFEDLTPEELAEVVMIILPMLAWEEIFSNVVKGTDAEVDAGLLSPPGANAPAIKAQIDALFSQFNALGNMSDWDNVLAACKDGTLPTLVADWEPLANAWLVEMYEQNLIDKYEVFKEAYLRGASQWTLLKILLETKSGSIKNITVIGAEYDAMWAWFNSLRWEGTFADVTALYLNLEIRAKAILNKIEYKDPLPPLPTTDDKIFDFFISFLPAPLANVATWIVKYLFFGWLWGRWL